MATNQRIRINNQDSPYSELQGQKVAFEHDFKPIQQLHTVSYLLTAEP